MTILFENKTRRLVFILLIILILATLAFIFGNSLESVEESKKTSADVVERVKPFLEPVVGKGNVTDHLVRKMAHFIEFFVLGIELLLLLLIIKYVCLSGISYCAFFGLVAALTDETIQIFSSRGSQVQDVWLDFAGCCTGLLTAFFVSKVIFMLIKPVKHKSVSDNSTMQQGSV